MGGYHCRECGLNNGATMPISRCRCPQEMSGLCPACGSRITAGSIGTRCWCSEGTFAHDPDYLREIQRQVASLFPDLAPMAVLRSSADEPRPKASAKKPDAPEERHPLFALRTESSANSPSLPARGVQLDVRIFQYVGFLKARPLLNTGDLTAIKTSLLDAYLWGDDQYVQILLANLRVKDPAVFGELHDHLAVFQSVGRLKPSAKSFDQGSYGRNLHPIERIIHRVWFGGKMKDTTVANILTLQKRVTASKASSTRWEQYLWTSSVANYTSFLGFATTNPLTAQLAELAKAGVVIIDVDTLWSRLHAKIPHAQTKGLKWTKEARDDLHAKRYDNIKFLSDLVRLVALYLFGGIYMDTDIGCGDSAQKLLSGTSYRPNLTLCNRTLFHLDADGEIALHGPPFRVPKDYQEVIAKSSLGATPQERIVRHADDSVPALNYFIASRSGTQHVERELVDMFERATLNSGMALFGRLFVPLGADLSQRPTPWVPSEQRLFPWLLDLEWVTDASIGEG